MMERSAEPRLTAPIVPDPNDELAAHSRSAAVPRPRTWPLWLACLLLAAGLTVLAGFYWLDRQTWQTAQRELEGQVSNLHARFDSLDERQDIEGTQERLAELDANQQSLQEQLEKLVNSLRRLEEQSVSDARLDEVIQRLEAAGEEQDILVATLEAMQSSLDTLEQSGKDARQVLQARLGSAEDELDAIGMLAPEVKTLSAAQEELQTRAAELDEAYTQLQEQVHSLAENAGLAELGSRLDQLADDVETLQADDRQRWERLASRIESNQAGLFELRQNQVALSAGLESLGNRIERAQ